MKHSSKLVLCTVALACGAFAQSSFAEEGLAYNIGVVSQYRYRGLAQTKGEPALQGGIDYDAGNGFYLGTWGSTIKWIKETGIGAGADTKGPLELDLYGGYKFEAAGVGFDVGYLRYEYVGNTLKNASAAGYANANTDEVYGAATYGVTTLKYSHAFSNLFGLDNSKNSTYWDLSANFDLGGGYTLTPHVGRQMVKNFAQYSYTDYALTLGKDLGNGLSASIAAIGTNGKEADFTTNGYFVAKSALVVGLKYAF